jgi:hypothetical protein
MRPEIGAPRMFVIGNAVMKSAMARAWSRWRNQ